MSDLEWWDVPTMALMSLILSICFFFLMLNLWGMSQMRSLSILAAVNAGVWIPSLIILWIRRTIRRREFERRRAK